MGTIGPRLRAAREARNLTVEQAAEDTRISLRFLQALEREEFEALPAPVYVRGFLRSYGNYLGLEPQSLLEELESNSGFEKGPAAYVRGPANGESAAGPRTADPFRSRAVAAPASTAGGEWDPEPNQAPPPPARYEQPRGDYQARAVPGVLVERGYEGGGSRAPLFVVAGGIGAIIVLVVLIAVAALGGGDDGGGLPVAGDDATATATTGGGGQTVIAVGSPTAATAAPGDDTPTPAAGETEAPTATPSGPTNTPGPAPTATATVPPTDTPLPTATATSVPPTATPTELPFHPTAFQECTAAGLNDCGPGELRVICGPRGWFVDYNHGVEPYPNPGWSEFLYTGRLFDLADVAEATCQ